MGMGGNLELFYKDSQIILVGLISFLIIFGIAFIIKKRKSVKSEDKLKENINKSAKLITSSKKPKFGKNIKDKIYNG